MRGPLEWIGFEVEFEGLRCEGLAPRTSLNYTKHTFQFLSTFIFEKSTTVVQDPNNQDELNIEGVHSKNGVGP